MPTTQIMLHSHNDGGTGGTLLQNPTQLTVYGASVQTYVGADSSNRLSIGVSAAGAITYTSTGASAGHTWSQAATFGSSLTVSAGGVALNGPYNLTFGAAGQGVHLNRVNIGAVASLTSDASGYLNVGSDTNWARVVLGNATTPTYVTNGLTVSAGGVAVTGASRVTGGALQLGTAASSLGQLGFNGNTSGTVTMQSAAAAGTWTLTLPTTAGTNTYALATDGAGVTTWEAVTLPSERRWKNDLGLVSPEDGLRAILATPVHRYSYRDGAPVRRSKRPEYWGPFADEAPWSMEGDDGDRIIAGQQTLGYMILGFQATDRRIGRLERDLASLRAGPN